MASDSQGQAPEHGSAGGIRRLEVVTTVTPHEEPTTERERRIESLSTAELIRQASGQLSSLVRDELALARAEMTVKAKRAGLGAGLFGAAGLVSLYGVFGVLAGVVLLIGRVIPVWGSALAIGGLLIVMAAVLGLAGTRQVKRVTPPVRGTTAAASIRDDLSALRSALRRGGRS